MARNLSSFLPWLLGPIDFFLNGVKQNVQRREKVNLVAPGATVTDDPANERTIIELPGGGGSFTAAGDLSGSSSSQTVEKVKGTTITTAGGALPVGAVLRTTAAGTADWGAVNLADTDAVTGTLPAANGGTGLSALGSPLQVLRTNAGGTAVEWGVIAGSSAFTATGLETDWYIDAVSGSDSNSGTVIGAPLRTHAELERRTRNVELDPPVDPTSSLKEVRVHILTDLPSTEPVNITFTTDPGVSVRYIGENPTVIQSGTFTAVTTAVPATNTPWSVKDGTSGAANLASYIGSPIRITASAVAANVGAVMWVAKDQGSGDARVSTPSVPGANITSFGTVVTPQAGDSYEVLGLRKLTLNRVDLVGGQGATTNGLLTLESLEIGPLASGYLWIKSDRPAYFRSSRFLRQLFFESNSNNLVNCCFQGGVTTKGGRCIVAAGASVSTAGAVNAGLVSLSGTIAVYASHLCQGVRVQGQSFFINSLAVFDTATALNVGDVYVNTSPGSLEGGAFWLLNATNSASLGSPGVWGAGNSGVGALIAPNCILYIANGYAGLLSVTGASGDFILGNSATTSRPWHEAANNYGPAVSNTWANLYTTVANGGLGGNAHDPLTDASIVVVGFADTSPAAISTATSVTLKKSETFASVTASGQTITLPASPFNGEVHQVKSAGAFTTVIAGNGANVDGSASYTQVVSGETTVVRYSTAAGQWQIVSNAGGAGGETNTASNVGSGSQLYKQKTGVNLEFRSLVAGSNITLTQNANDVTIAASGGATITEPNWYIDGTNGNDANDGLTAATALKTATALVAKWGRAPILQPTGGTMTVHVLTSIPNTDPLELDNCRLVFGNTLVFAGTATTERTGTITSLVTQDRTTNTPWQITDSALGASAWTTDIGKRVRITTGANAGTYAWVAKDLGLSTARMSNFATTTNSIAAPVSKAPTNGDTYVVESLPTLRLRMGRGFEVGIGSIYLRDLQLTVEANEQEGVLVAHACRLNYFGWTQSAISGYLSNCCVFGTTATVFSQEASLRVQGGLYRSDFTFQGFGFNVINSDAMFQGAGALARHNTILDIDNAAFFDATQAIRVGDQASGAGPGYVRLTNTATSGHLWGSGNTNGITIGPGSYVQMNTAANVKMTSTQDIRFGGSDGFINTGRMWVESKDAFSVALTASWANLTTYGNLQDVEKNAIIFTEQAPLAEPAIADPTTASNVGTGSGLYKQKTGVNLEFRSLVAGSNITLTQNTNDVTIAASGSANITGTDGEVVTKSGANGVTATNVVAGSSYLSVGTSVATAGNIRLPSNGQINFIRTGGSNVLGLWMDTATSIAVSNANATRTTIYSGGNIRIEPEPSSVVELTRPLAMGTSAVANAGTIRMRNADSIQARNSSNSGNVTIADLDSGNRVNLGDKGEDIRMSARVAGNADATNGPSAFKFRVNIVDMPSGSNSAITLTAAEYQAPIQRLTGTAGDDRPLVFPNQDGAVWLIDNQTSGSVVCRVGSSGGVSFAQGTRGWIYCNGTNIVKVTAPV